MGIPSAAEHVEIAVVGGGQAGLVMSYWLTQDGREHLVLDRGQVADTWRRQRWDSFHLVTPNWQLQLPGRPYDGDDPDGFLHRDTVVAYLERYAQGFHPPLRPGTEVTSLRARSGGGYRLETPRGPLVADQVVVATGTYHRPRIPRMAMHLDPAIVQLHTRDYKRPTDLPPGAVLVVGSGQSGCQVVEDLLLSGRRVHLAVSRAPRLPRRYRGHDMLWWLDRAGLYDVPVDRHADGAAVRFKTHPHVSGRDGGHTINLRRLAVDGVTLHGRLAGMEGTRAHFLDDLAHSLDQADAGARRFTDIVDEYIARHGLVIPEDGEPEMPWTPPSSDLSVDLVAGGISSVIWATGYGLDFRWIDLPVLDERGYPRYHRGITSLPGLCFLGLHWQHTWGSGLFYHVGRDAAFLAEHLRAARRGRVAARPTGSAA